MRVPHLCIVVNSSAFLVSHRLPIVVEARRRGWRVTALVGPQNDERDAASTSRLRSLGCSIGFVRMTRSRIGVLDAIRTIVSLRGHFQTLEPDIIHLVTPKLIVLGGIAGRLWQRSSMVLAVSGLGYLYTGSGIVGRLKRALVRIGFGLSTRHRRLAVIVQNSDDERLLKALVSRAGAEVHRVNGSGVDLAKYRPAPEEQPDGIVLPARMLRSKGVVEFLKAIQLLRRNGFDGRVWLAGALDPGNPEALSLQDLQALCRDSRVEWLGYQSDMSQVYSRATIACLPSYREGLPLALAEAAAAGLAIVTTDVPGCRETVVAGETGLLVPPRDVAKLAEALNELINDPARRRMMSIAARRYAERSFSVDAIVAAHFSIYEKLL